MLAQQYAAAINGSYEGDFYEKPPQQIFYNEQHVRPPFYHQFGEATRFGKPRPRYNPRSSGEPTKTLFVGNLAIDVGEECLHQLFSKFGQVTECCKRWFHYAFVRFEEEEQAERALKTLDGFKIAGRPMRVEFQRRKMNPRFYPPKLTKDQTVRNPFASIKYSHHQKESEYVPPMPLPPFPFAESDDDPNGFSIFRRPSDKIVYRNDYKTYELFPKDEEHPLVLLFQKYKPTERSGLIANNDQENAWKFENLKREIEVVDQYTS